MPCLMSFCCTTPCASRNMLKVHYRIGNSNADLCEDGLAPTMMFGCAYMFPPTLLCIGPYMVSWTMDMLAEVKVLVVICDDVWRCGDVHMLCYVTCSFSYSTTPFYHFRPVLFSASSLQRPPLLTLTTSLVLPHPSTTSRPGQRQGDSAPIPRRIRRHRPAAQTHHHIRHYRYRHPQCCRPHSRTLPDLPASANAAIPPSAISTPAIPPRAICSPAVHWRAGAGISPTTI
jgi:hypothetical protein